jgi:Ca2+-binding RTX toxin-like protein
MNPLFNLIFGGIIAQTYNGTEGADFFIALFADDTVFGNGGDDVIDGGVGNDIISGGEGNDTLGSTGDLGNDIYSGDAGNDTITGGSGNDQIDGGIGNDRLDGGLDNDIVTGGEGNDTVIGGAGNDTVIGGAGNDTVIGVDPTSSLAGIFEIDTLIDGVASGGQNTYVLGNTQSVFYNDTLTFTAGTTDFAVIAGFNAAADRFQLRGRAADYQLTASTIPNLSGTAIVLRKEQLVSEVIAVVQGVAPTSLNLQNTGDFVYV